MAGLVLIRSTVDALRRVARSTTTSLSRLLLGTEEDALMNRDPIMEVVSQNPQEAIRFIKLVMLFGATTGVLVSVPCVVYLVLYWEECRCNKPLQWWVSVFSALQVSQVPVRYLFFFHLHTTPNNRAAIINTTRTLTGGSGWKCSKLVSILSYGWFILGVVWVFNAHECTEAPGLWKLTVSAIVISMLRLVTTFICFWISFPPNTAGLDPNVDRFRSTGASPDQIARLPLLTYAEKKVELRRIASEKKKKEAAEAVSGLSGGQEEGGCHSQEKKGEEEKKRTEEKEGEKKAGEIGEEIDAGGGGGKRGAEEGERKNERRSELRGSRHEAGDDESSMTSAMISQVPHPPESDSSSSFCSSSSSSSSSSLHHRKPHENTSFFASSSSSLFHSDRSREGTPSLLPKRRKSFPSLHDMSASSSSHTTDISSASSTSSADTCLFTNPSLPGETKKKTEEREREGDTGKEPSSANNLGVSEPTMARSFRSSKTNDSREDIHDLVSSSSLLSSGPSPLHPSSSSPFGESSAVRVSYNAEEERDIHPLSKKEVKKEEAVEKNDEEEDKEKKKAVSPCAQPTMTREERAGGALFLSGYVEQRGEEFSSVQENCCICLSEFSDEEILRELLCSHFFHQGCIDKWLLKNKHCPLCLRQIDEK
ncbi:zinc c3hc4 type (ring finger) domain-containing protein [Cystoisospora suis]|uniref:Zinc c3hc4 type (Ring finger) domain-containing protein n=1 Tax=Cystoisospora suis TaxID=483139 RepID=A0A2C6KJ58_9APIC|nr:zinc c3hc4 type (ring finger) domain-containing protein [Cystoisospora suis]